ncbi:MAG: DUF1993 domain-containing protein [Pseudomonadota bacterium]
MTTSLYDLSVATYLQTIGGSIVVLEKGAGFASANGIDPDELVQTRLSEDMWPLHNQIVSIVHQSVGAVKALRSGTFSPPSGYPENMDYAGLQDFLREGYAALEAETPDAINALADNPVVFRFAAVEIPFTAVDFVLSFSLPNFYFHAATAYDLLRMRGVPLSKRHYLGRLRSCT